MSIVGQTVNFGHHVCLWPTDEWPPLHVLPLLFQDADLLHFNVKLFVLTQIFVISFVLSTQIISHVVLNQVSIQIHPQRVTTTYSWDDHYTTLQLYSKQHV